jgi:Zn-dependent protease
LVSSNFAICVFEFVLLIFSLSFHECAHAWMASRLGDQTARLQGRITLNPAAHADPIGTLLFPALVIFGPLIGLHLPFMLIGWARPVPVITRNFRKIVRDDNMVSLAGPAANFTLVAVFTVVLIVGARLMPETALNSFLLARGYQMNGSTNGLLVLASLAILVNLSLTFFNLLPIPPLDGSHVLRNMLPYNAMKTYDMVGGWLSILLMMTVGGFLMNLLVSPFILWIQTWLVRLQPQMLLLQ